MHFFGFAVGDEAGTSMAAGNRSAIPSDRYGDPPGRFPRLPRDAPWKIIAAIEQWRREEAERITRQRRPDLAR